jgi:hypothetical protein
MTPESMLTLAEARGIRLDTGSMRRVSAYKSVEDVPEDLFREAVAGNTSPSGVRRDLALPKRAPKESILQRARDLGLDTSHFRVGRARSKPSFTCKLCGQVVQLQKGERARTYCSDPCLQEGRSRSISATQTPERRAQTSDVIRKSWEGEGCERRMASMNNPETRARRLRATRLAAQSPELRAKRSANAKARWDADPDLRESFIKAATEDRRRRALQGTSPRKPHVPYVSNRRSETVMVRSYWERDFAMWLDEANLDWAYEPVRVVVDGKPYTPDFVVILPTGRAYIELHRVQRPAPGDTKVAKMTKAAPKLDAPLLLLGGVEIAAVREQLRAQVVDLTLSHTWRRF